jgi:hypothetical protein
VGKTAVKMDMIETTIWENEKDAIYDNWREHYPGGIKSYTGRGALNLELCQKKS